MPSPSDRPQRGTGSQTGHHRIPHPRNGHRAPSSRTAARAPDLAAAAGEAVIRFLHDSSVAVAEPEGSRAAEAGTRTLAVTDVTAGNAVAIQAREPDGIIAAPKEAMPWSAASGAGQLNAESVALRAAAVSVSTLDRIELMAAKLEADIASAHRAQAELQAGAGAAAAAAIRAAQAAWAAAGTAVDADKSAKVSLLKIARYVEATVALVVVAMIILVITATSLH